ncbi:unnamed protein product [Rhizophagus irregularis]|nr:unnamed protein product [Rhizophagus irregularis]CAB5347333.1 unnamed protein product [Rhizophagus irregularis]
MGGVAQKIPIPADPPNSGGPCYDYKLYFEKRPVDAESDFYLQANPRWQETGIWYRKQHIGRNNLSGFMKALAQETGIDVNGLTNHSG